MNVAVVFCRPSFSALLHNACYNFHTERRELLSEMAAGGRNASHAAGGDCESAGWVT